MWNRLISSPLVYVYLLIGTIAATSIGFFTENKIVLPVLQIAIAYPILYSLLTLERRKRAFVAMLFWALSLAIVVVTLSIQFPASAQTSIFHGTAYVEEMFHWIKTGEGAEGNPVQFVPVHLVHFVIFALLSLLTASVLSLLMGALLMNYMSFYVASVIVASHGEWIATLMAWHPWSAIRVASFVILGVILAEPLICKIQKRDYEYLSIRRYFWFALHGLAIDILMKAFLAPWWGTTLRKFIF
jgi:hypothetical protein